MFDKKTDYALNKQDPEAIVCQKVKDGPVRLTCEDFASSEEFLKWKDWSDEDYHAKEMEEHRYNNHSVPLEAVEGITVSSPESVLVDSIKKTERDKSRAAALKQLQYKLTDKQYRRLCMYYIEGKTQAEIAAEEGVGQRRISTSISSGKKIVERFFEKFFDNRG